MDLGIDGRRAAVAAASKGLGLRAPRQALADEGRARSRSAAATASDRRGRGARSADAVPLVADVAHRGGRHRLRATRRGTRSAGVDILVANAGGPPPGNFASTRRSTRTAQAFELNCLATIAMCNAAVPGDAGAAVGAGRRDHVDRGAPADRRT